MVSALVLVEVHMHAWPCHLSSRFIAVHARPSPIDAYDAAGRRRLPPGDVAVDLEGNVRRAGRDGCTADATWTGTNPGKWRSEER